MTDAGRIHLVSCVGVERDLPLLPHWLEHYLGLGIRPDDIHLVLNTREPGSPALASARELLRRQGIEPADLWIGPYTSGDMWTRRRGVQERLTRPGDWVVSADVDELHGYPAPLRRFLARCERQGVNAIQGVFVDRLAPDGALRPVADHPAIPLQFPVKAEVACRIGGTGRHHGWLGTVKMMAFVAPLRPGLGGHTVEEPVESSIRFWFGTDIGRLPFIDWAWFRALLPLQVHHYKWTTGLPGAIRTRLRTAGASAGGSEYGAKVMRYCEAHGRIRLEDVAVYRFPRLLRMAHRLGVWRPILRAGQIAFAALRPPGRLVKRLLDRPERRP